MKRIAVILGVAALAVAACGKKDKNKQQAATSPGEHKPTAPDQPKAKLPEPPRRRSITGFKTPESVLYDPDADVYLVSNINGDPFAADGNGFISRVRPDGSAEIWIDGSTKEVTLNAPKGTALLGDTLYVADIDTVRMFDRKTGAPKGDIAIKGALFLNDMAAGPDSVYVSDTGVKPGFAPGGADAIYQIKDGKATPVIKAKDLGGPNGILVDGDALWVVTFGSGEIYQVKGGKREGVVKPPKGQLDGVLRLDGGDLLVSSWEAKAVFRGPPGGPFVEAETGLESPADIGWDSKRKILMVPLFMKDTVELIPLAK